MRRKVSKCVVLLLTVIAVLSYASVCYAADEDVPRVYVSQPLQYA